VFRVFLLLLLTFSSLFAVAATVENNATQKEDIIKNILDVKKESNVTMVKSLDLDGYIEMINDYPLITKINGYLDYIHTDIGRLALFLLVVILSFVLKDIGQMIFPALQKVFPETEEVHDIEVSDFAGLKKPMAFLVTVFGINLAIDVLFYPSDEPLFINILFYCIYLFGFFRLFSVFVDIFFDVYFINSYKKRNKSFRKELVNLIKQILKVFAFIVAFLLLLNKLNINITGFIASLGLGGLVIAMASRDTIANFFGSLKIIIDESFSQGDWIEIGDVEGTVVELGFISTKIRTFDNALISFPNAKLSNESVKNYNKRKIGRRIKMKIGVTYDSKRENLLNAVKEIKEMLIAHPEIATSNKIRYIPRRSSLVEHSDMAGIKSTLLVHVDSFSDSSIDILVYAFSKTTSWGAWLKVKEDIMMKIWQILENNDLEMAFPTQTIHVKDVNREEKGS
jgi:MscS family membrane protein